MRDFEFHTPVKVIFGRNKITEVEKLCAGKRVMLVYGGKSLKRNGTYDTLMTLLNKANAKVTEYGGQVSAAMEMNQKGIAIAKENHIEVVIGVGGAIAMDMAKVIAFGAKHDNLETYLGNWSIVNDEEKLTTILIPTYPSTGSETDAVSDIEDAKSLIGVYADYAILDPTLTFSLDRRNTAYSALVTFIQASVYYLSNDNEIAKGFGEVILKKLLSSYDTLLKDPDNYDARGNIMWASALTTMSVTDIGLNDPYIWSVYEVGSYPRRLHDVSYREGVTMMYPQWLKYIARKHFDDIKYFMVHIFNIDENTEDDVLIENGCEAFRELLRKGGLPVSCSFYGEMSDEHILIDTVKQHPVNGFTYEELLQMLVENYQSK